MATDAEGDPCQWRSRVGPLKAAQVVVKLREMKPAAAAALITERIAETFSYYNLSQ